MEVYSLHVGALREAEKPVGDGKLLCNGMERRY